MPTELDDYGFGEAWERGDVDFPSVEEALAHAQKNGDGYETVNIGRQEVFEFRVDGNAVLDKIDDDVEAEGIDVCFFWTMDIPDEVVDDLSEMLTKTFCEWADKHGCAKFIKTVVDCEEYDLTTGRVV